MSHDVDWGERNSFKIRTFQTNQQKNKFLGYRKHVSSKGFILRSVNFSARSVQLKKVIDAQQLRANAEKPS